jgi:hypothetical protein
VSGCLQQCANAGCWRWFLCKFIFFYLFLYKLFRSIQEDLTPQTTKKVLAAFKKGQKPKPGPQSARQTSENSAGLTSLTSKVCSLQSKNSDLESKCLAHSRMDLVNFVCLNSNRSRYLARRQGFTVLIIINIVYKHLCRNLNQGSAVIMQFQSSPSPSSYPCSPSPPSGSLSIMKLTAHLSDSQSMKWKTYKISSLRSWQYWSVKTLSWNWIA